MRVDKKIDLALKYCAFFGEFSESKGYVPFLFYRFVRRNIYKKFKREFKVIDREVKKKRCKNVKC